MEDNSTPPKLGWLKARIDALRITKGHTEKWLYERVGMTKTGYRQMWERDTVRVVVLEDIARHLGTTLVRLLTEEEAPMVLNEPAATYGKPRYLEDRIEAIEREVRQLKDQIKNR